MPGNPHDSTWFATPRERRNRKPLSVTLSAEARGKLEAMAEVAGMTLSAAVEVLVLAPEANKQLRKATVVAPKKGRGSAKP